MAGRPKGIPKTGGRKKGTLGKRRAEIAVKVISEGITPLEFLLDVMRNEENMIDQRVDAAKSAAPYIHKKMPQAIDGNLSGKFEFSWLD